MKGRKNRIVIKVIAVVALVLSSLGAARAELLNNRIDAPVVESAGIFGFSAATGKLTTDPAQTFAWALYLQDGEEPLYFTDYNAPLSIDIKLDQNGEVVDTGSDSPDLVISGEITIPGQGSFSGVLLTAKIAEFGFEDGGPERTYDSFDFRFSITGGQLAFLWEGKDLGVYFDFEPSYDNPMPFTGSFTGDFNGFFQTTRIGGIKPAPMACTGVVTRMKINDSEFFPTVVMENGVERPVYPVLSRDNNATFELEVTNCDESADVTIGRVKRKGAWYGRPKNEAGQKITLAPGESFEIDKNNPNTRFRKLHDPNVCKFKSWTASTLDLTFDVLLRKGCERNSVFGPVFAKCACVSIKKEVSKDGGNNYRNANNPCGAPDEKLKNQTHFYYRYVVTNPCAADLQDISITDDDLGVSYALPGILATGAAPMIIDHTVIPALRQPAAQVCEEGDIETEEGCGKNKVAVNFDKGVAHITAKGVKDPALDIFQQPEIIVTDEDSTCLKCLP